MGVHPSVRHLVPHPLSLASLSPAPSAAQALTPQRVPRVGKPGPQRHRLRDPHWQSLHLTLGHPPSLHPGTPTRPTAGGRGDRWVQAGAGVGGAAGEQPRRWGAAPTPASPAPPPAPHKAPLLAAFLFSHVSPLSIKAIFKVNYLLPSAARPTPLHQHQPQPHVAK